MAAISTILSAVQDYSKPHYIVCEDKNIRIIDGWLRNLRHNICRMNQLDTGFIQGLTVHQKSMKFYLFLGKFLNSRMC